MSRSKYRPKWPRWWTPVWRNIEDRRLRRRARVALLKSAELDTIVIEARPTMKGYFD